MGGVIHALALVLALLWLFYALYIAVMGLYRAYLAKSLTPQAMALGAPCLLAGALMDVACNYSLAIVIFAEWPHELLVTSRLERHLKAGDGWRYALASWVCTRLLDPLDPRGKHCTTN